MEIAGAVEWEHVSFSYSRVPANGATTVEPHYALTDISVKVPARRQARDRRAHRRGQIHDDQAAVRLIEPTSGRVAARRPRHPRHSARRTLRRAIGLVPQEPTLFSDTMARNIAFGRSHAPPGEILDAAHHRGTRSRSRGDAARPRYRRRRARHRRSRAARSSASRIARALTYDPAVIVLDDALSSVDTETERAVLQHLTEGVARPHHDRGGASRLHRARRRPDRRARRRSDRRARHSRGTDGASAGSYAELFNRQLLEEELAEY